MDEITALERRVRLLEDGLWALVNELLADEEESDVVAATALLRDHLERAALVTLDAPHRDPAR
ncbi:MAG TPA: hypothetical protein VNJ53_00040 [Gaiellaceae bacterium]|nr:hypothetical protein [Gaiellaceae bacterium]